MDKKVLRWQMIEQFLQTHEYIMNADVRELCGVRQRRPIEFWLGWRTRES